MRGADAAVRAHYQDFADWLQRTPAAKIAQKRDEAERAFHRVGITFAVYGEDSGTERLIPFDIVPRIIPAAEWRTLEQGLKQRVRALNLFLHDIYHDHAILKAGVLPGHHQSFEQRDCCLAHGTASAASSSRALREVKGRQASFVLRGDPRTLLDQELHQVVASRHGRM